jgi:hypothetical protein
MDNAAMSIGARASIAASPSEVFGLLGDLDRHREITDRGLRIVSLQGPPGRRTGGLVELRGPAGLTRLARTSVHGAEPHSRLWGAAETAEGAEAFLEWRVEPDGDGTQVEVRVYVRAGSWRDRLLLRLGGKLWLRARLHSALARLEQVAAGPEAPVATCGAA